MKPAVATYIAQHLGAHITDDDTAKFLFWHSAIEQAVSVTLEVFVPSPNLIFDKPDQHANVRYRKFPLLQTGSFACGIIEHLPVGNRHRFGALYQLCLQYPSGKKEIIRDPMAASLPYGIHAPAELYDTEAVLANRRDSEYFQKLNSSFQNGNDYRIGPSVNILEIHPGTATSDGTLEGLTHRYRQIVNALKNGEALSPDEMNLLGFDAVELMPIDPVVQHPDHHLFWDPIQTSKKDGDEITVRLQKPHVINWGYDIVIFGSAAINPSLLSTGRPHELLEFIETLHKFPGRPVKVILDVVYGHADDQALELMPEEFFAGPGKYGRNINFQHPLVRAMILEMQRRKINWGFDGIRVDSAQDFTYYDNQAGRPVHDDLFLREMSEVEQEVAGVTYKPWMIFEDGRPWPRNDWELASTCREITKQQEHAWQWAPTIFAYNTPYNYTYWISKWWRIEELLSFGDKWISGYSNHDTMRRGSQADPAKININLLLGNSLKMVMDNTYNNPSATLLMNGFLPGIPMDFIHALGNTPWSFIRDTDTGYAIKIAAEEAHFTEWQITDVEYRNSRCFKRLKDLGFASLAQLRIFAKTLLRLVQITDYNPDQIAGLLTVLQPAGLEINWTVKTLNQYATAWMADLNEYCNADFHADYIDPKKSAFNLSVREFRIENPWLHQAFGTGDVLKYRTPIDGAVIFYGYRRDTKSGKELVFAANMEGQPRQIHLTDLNLPIVASDDWSVVLSTPTLKVKPIHQPIRLSVSQAILFQK